MAVLKLVTLMAAQFGIISAFEVAEPFQPSRDNLLGAIEIWDEMHIELDVEIHSFTVEGDNKWANIIQASNGENNGRPGSRMPAIWIHPENTERGFLVCFGTDEDYSDCEWTETGAAPGGSYNLQIDVTQSRITVHVNGEVVRDDAIGTHPTYMGSDALPLYACSEWFEPADVTISNLVVVHGETMPPMNDIEIANKLSTLDAKVDKLDDTVAKLEEKVGKLVHTMDGLSEWAGTSMADIIDQRMDFSAGSVGGNYDGFQAAPVEGDAMSIVLTAKDLAIVGLAAVTLMTTVCIVVSCKRSPGKGRYGVVSMGSCSD